MESQLHLYMEKAFQFEEKGCTDKAVSICLRCMQIFPEYKNDIFLEIAKMNYRNQNEEEALLQFLELYQLTGNDDIIQLVFDAYYNIHLQEYTERYEENCRQLQHYPYFYGNRVLENAGRIRFYPIFSGKDEVYYYDSFKKEFKSVKLYKVKTEEPKDITLIVNDVLNMNDILLLEKMTRMLKPCMDEENPLMLVYQEETWELFLQMMDISKLAAFDRIVLIDSYKGLESAIRSGLFQGLIFIASETNLEKLTGIITAEFEKLEQVCTEYEEEIVTYYKNNAQTVMRNIEEGKPKILFIASRYTTALQYHTRDCKKAAERLGIVTELIIEPNRIANNKIWTNLKMILKFKPDIIFLLDHFRFEDSLFAKIQEVVFITWVQDPMLYIMDKQTPGKLGPRDIVLTHYTTWKDFWNVGYDAVRVIDAPIPANSHIYKKYELTPQEKEKYSCDLCLVCHAADADSFIEKELESHSEEIRIPLYEVYKGYQEYVLSTGNLFETQNECRLFLEGALRQHYALELSEPVLNYESEQMFRYFNEIMFRQALVSWLIDAGYDNIKLWGNGWMNDPKYAKYAMGPAENGETLSKIYQASKIVVGNNNHTSAAARAWESMLSGAFYMAVYIPPEEDFVDIRKIMKADEELVMFNGREDFLNKVEYYLTHEEERLRMAEIGQKAALERMTYDIMMERVMKELPERLRKLQQGEKADGR